ncbi:MAG: FAD-binding protein, partial [Aquabacterium commune]|uniref:FAD-binding protein n=1 Tax=Aquabacterium commune TaxID=70586 RepID=UPI003BB092AE
MHAATASTLPSSTSPSGADAAPPPPGPEPLTPAALAARQQAVVAALLRVLPVQAVLWHTEAVAPFECDGLSAYRQRPLAVALPETHAQVGQVLAACHALGVPVVARGGGTGLSGGALPDA